MMKRRILWSLLGAVILFVWGFVGHAGLRIYDAAFMGLTDEAEVTAAIERNAPARGLYYLPLNPDYQGPPQTEAFINFVPAGERAGFGSMMLVGFLVHLVAVFLVLSLLAAKPWRGYGREVARFSLAGFTIAFVAHAYYWNWFGFPGVYFLIALADSLIGWTLVGLALAILIQKSQASPQVKR